MTRNQYRLFDKLLVRVYHGRVTIQKPNTSYGGISKRIMEAGIVVVLIALFELATLRWGFDSRDHGGSTS
jgi:hypothetical protein